MPANRPHTCHQAAEQLGEVLKKYLDFFSEPDAVLLFQVHDMLADTKKINLETIETMLIEPLTALFKRFRSQKKTGDFAKAVYKVAYEVLITFARQFPRNDFNEDRALIDPVDLSKITDEEIKRGEIFFTTDRFAFRIANFTTWCEGGKINPLTRKKLSAWDNSLFEALAKRSKQAPSRKGKAAEVKADEDSLETLLPDIKGFIEQLCEDDDITTQERDTILGQMKKKTKEEQFLLGALLKDQPTLLLFINRVLPFKLETYKKMLTFIEKYRYLLNEDILNLLVLIARANRLDELLRSDLSFVEEKRDDDESLIDPSARLSSLMKEYTSCRGNVQTSDLSLVRESDNHDERLIFLEKKIKESLNLFEKYGRSWTSVVPFFMPCKELSIIKKWITMLTDCLKSHLAENPQDRCARLTCAFEELRGAINDPNKGGILSVVRYPRWDGIFGEIHPGALLCDKLKEIIEKKREPVIEPTRCFQM